MINKIRAKLYALVFWQTRLGEIANKIYDLKLFFFYSFTENKLNNKENLQAFLTKQYHIIEKGLALPESRSGFGKLKIKVLITRSEEYEKLYGKDRIIQNIKETLKQYLERNEQLKKKDYPFYLLISNFLFDVNDSKKGGVKKVSLNEIKKSISIDFESFVKTRTSVRDYSTEDILESEVFKAVEMARYTPSVCNRQSWKVHYFKNKNLKNQLLKLQGGNGGFTDSINQLLIITTDVRRFTKYEGNQIFIDGGLFAMNLILSLHAQVIGTCCLNTCLPYIVENKIKKIGKIAESERLIMMIGIGKLKENFEVAISDKITVEEILENKK
jgi:nitroreductase